MPVARLRGLRVSVNHRSMWQKVRGEDAYAKAVEVYDMCTIALGLRVRLRSQLGRPWSIPIIVGICVRVSAVFAILGTEAASRPNFFTSRFFVSSVSMVAREDAIGRLAGSVSSTPR